jgi:glycosyltransferase involved in cell wall biosynthesis
MFTCSFISIGLPYEELPRVEPTAYVVLPTRNQAGELPSLVGQIFRRCGSKYHIVIVDDHSTDCTPSVVRALCVMYAPRLHYVQYSDC